MKHAKVQGSPLRIASVAALLEHEPAIVRHLNGLENGGLLFSLDPLRLLAEIGVELEPQVTHEVIRAHPEIERCGGPAYAQIASQSSRHRIHITVRGLFNLRGDAQ